MAEVTSKISVTKLGTSVRNKKSVYTATKVTKTQTQPVTYQTEIIKYDDAKGSNPVTIGTRNPTTGKITFNDNASSQEKNYSSTLGKTSANQMTSPEIQSLATTAQQKAALNASAGQSNQALGSGVSNQQQGGVVGGQGGNKSRYSSGVNAASTGSGSSSTPISQQKQGAIEPGTRLTGFPNLIYPLTLLPSERDVIKFTMMQYLPGGFSGKGRAQAVGKRNLIGSVTLPIPGGIQDSATTDWGNANANPIELAQADVMLTGMQEGLAEAGTKLQSKIKDAQAESEDVKKGLSAAILSSVSGIGKQALKRGEGMTLNPNMELLFNGPALRDFTFMFRLSARNSKEAEAILKIIKFFKQGMAPIRTQSGFFLKAPHTFELKYMHQSNEHKGLNKFKECALKTCTVQYTPDGNYNTYNDGTMTSYTMNLSFGELEPIYNDDYNNDDFDASIGY